MPLLHPSDDISNRAPVWNAMAAFFLDNELQEIEISHIAEVCSLSPYSQKELERIMFSEVWPAFLPNLLAITGEWSGWPEDFVIERVMKRYRRDRIYFSWRFNPLKRYCCGAWASVEKQVDMLRRNRSTTES